jgi:hypothetical protein
MGEFLRCADWYGRAFLLRALATILSEEANKIVHRLKLRRIDHGAAVATDSDQSRKAEAVEMECQRVGSEAEPFGDLAGRHAFRPGLYEHPKDCQTVFLGECSQRRDSVRRSHISTNIETFWECQWVMRYMSRQRLVL